MQDPPAKRPRVEDISLQNVCERQEVGQVIFTLGLVEVPISRSGVAPEGSACRQFWHWLGTTDEYEPRRIRFTVDELGAIRIGLPAASDFRVVLNGDSELASILTLSRPDDQRKVSARIVMTGNYPDSDFKKAGWHPNRELDPDTLVDIDADLRGDLLYIEGFYSKASDPVAYPALSRNDVQRVRGIARHLMCIVLRALPSVSKVELMASGGSAWDKAQLQLEANHMQRLEILQSLHELNPKAFGWWQHRRNRQTQDMSSLRRDWVEIQANHRLVEYYRTKFGFAHTPGLSFTTIEMRAQASEVLRRCESFLKKRGLRQVSILRPMP